MAENLNIISGSKEEQYASLLPQIKSLIEGETDLIANLANVTAALKETFHFFCSLPGLCPGRRRGDGRQRHPRAPF